MPEGRYDNWPIEKIKQALWEHEIAITDVHLYRFGVVEQIHEITAILCDLRTEPKHIRFLHDEVAKITSKLKQSLQASETEMTLVD